MSRGGVKKTNSVPARLDRTHPIFDNSTTVDIFINPSFLGRPVESIPVRSQLETDSTNQISDVEAFMNVIKSSIEAGLLTIPYDFKIAGLLFSPFGIVLTAIICIHCLTILAKCSGKLCQVVKKSDLSYAETIEVAFSLCAGKKLKHYSSFARKFVEIFQFILQYGSCIIFMYMISSILKEVLSYQSKVQVINTRWYSIILLVIFLPVGFIRQIKYLVPFCPLASIFVLFSVLVVLYNNIQDLPPLSSRQHMGSVTDIPSFFFGVLFALQTTFVFLPLRTSVKYNKHYRQCPGVLCISISIIAFMYIIFGFFGYLKYGENTNAVNLFNLNHNGLSETIKIFIILSVLLSYNFQLIGAMDVVWNNIEHKFSAKYKTLLYYVIKDLLIVSTVIIVSFSLNLFPLLSLVGSLTLSTLCVILPLIIETITFWDITLGRWNWKLYKNILLTIISFVLTTVACVKSFSKIIEKY